jgi:hypothetical protein
MEAFLKILGGGFGNWPYDEVGVSARDRIQASIIMSSACESSSKVCHKYLILILHHHNNFS